MEEGRRGVLGSLAGSRHDVMSFPFKEDVCSFDVDSVPSLEQTCEHMHGEE